MMSGAASSRSRAPEDLLRALVETTTDHAICALDVEGNIVTWNPGAERLHGYRAADVLGRHVGSLYPEDDVTAGLPDRDLAIAVADGHHDIEGWRRRDDGTEFWANVVVTALRGDDGRLLGFGTVTRDLTERKRSEESLRESEERFRLLVTNVADYAIFLLDEQGNVATWNVGAERLKGYRTDEIIGRHISTFYTEEDRRAGVPAAALAEARSVGRWASEGWRVRRDGSRFWASVVLTSLVSADGTHRGFAKVTRDLTDRKRAEDSLRGVLARERDAAEQLRDLDRLRSELMSIIAHDLRAPAGVIQHLVYGLQQDWSTATDAQKLDAIDRIETRTARMASLADDLFDVSQIDAGHLDVSSKVVDVGPILEQIVTDASAARVVRVAVGAEVKAIGDERRIWQVVTNLVSNALKFSPVDTEVEVRADRIGDEVVIAVSDHGPGIPPDEAPRLFERFSRLSGTGSVPGTGIGLFIAKSLAEAQGGRLWFDTIEGEGATFLFALPAADA